MVAQSASRHKYTDGGLLFVNSSHPDDVKKRNTQHSIRSHSIRDAFRGRPSRKRKPQAVTYVLRRAYEPADAEQFQDRNGDMQCRIPKSLGLWPFPGELHPRAQELIYFSAYLRLLNQLVSSINEPVQ